MGYALQFEPMESRRISERLGELIGREHPVDEVARRLYALASDIAAPVVGAMHVTCADESERECIDALQHNFCEYLLPTLKFGKRAPFRLANLGGRYERAALGIADQHFSIARARRSWKLLLVKINAHVSVERREGATIFGRMARYRSESIYCGALTALLDGEELPFCDELRRALAIDGLDRLGLLRDASRVDPELRSLLAAVASAGVQSRRALDDILARPPEGPTLFVVLGCVTLNRKLKDSEIVCGSWVADRRGEEPEVHYAGVGDDPSRVRLVRGSAGLTLTGDDATGRRPD